MSLLAAIDVAVAFVHEYPECMTRAEVDEFCRLAEAVYIAAFCAGLVAALPQVPQMRPELESTDPPLPPPQFVSKLNLPGDWDLVLPLDQDGLPVSQPLFGEALRLSTERTFLVCAAPRWFADMATLRKLAEAGAEWSEVKSPSDWCKELGRISLTTLKRHVHAKRLVVRKLTTKSWCIRLDTLRAFQGDK